MIDSVIIRSFQPSDVHVVSHILSECFFDKFHRLISLDKEDISLFLERTGFVLSQSFPGFFVAELNGEVGGILLLKWKDQPVPPADTTAFELIHLGLFRVLKLYVGLWLLNHAPKDKECYVDFIAVNPLYQGRGVGSQLLSFAEEFAANNNLTSLSLYVASQNKGAMALYTRLGFVVQKTVNSLLTRFFVGFDEWKFMSKNVDGFQADPIL